jgi:restriction endonuclease S subunit
MKRTEKTKGALPTWETRRLKFLATCNDDTLPEETDPDYEIDYVDISSVNLIEGITKIEKLSFENAPSRARRRVKDGDTIISTVRTYLKAIASIQSPPENMIVSTGFAVVRPREIIDHRFLGYAMQSVEFIDAVVANSTGVSYPAINPTLLICIPVAYPTDKREQRKIAAFLDWKTGQIDGLIAKKQALLETLKEKRLALITQAVTKGLNPKAPLKDSGIPWLGKVPEHWEIMRLGYRIHIQEGQVDPEDNIYSEMLMIAPNHIESNTGRCYGILSASDQAAISGKYRVHKDDIVYSKIRPHLNKCTIVNFDGLCSADMYPIRPEKALIGRFLLYWMLAQPFLDYATESSMRVAMPKLNRDTLNAAPLVVPPQNEQRKIADFIDTETDKIDALVSEIHSAIARLAEYRTALITAATTGKIDVRNIKIPETSASPSGLEGISRGGAEDAEKEKCFL